VRALAAAPRGPSRQPHWFAALGGVVTAPWLYALGAASLVPRLVRAARSRGVPAGLVLQGVLFGVLLWRHPVVVLWVFLLPNLLASARGALVLALALAPLAALVGLCLVAWMRGFATGLWIAPWEVLLAVAALALLWLTGARRGVPPERPRAPAFPPAGRERDHGHLFLSALTVRCRFPC
jgi:hypothetical protein